MCYLNIASLFLWDIIDYSIHCKTCSTSLGNQLWNFVALCPKSPSVLGFIASLPVHLYSYWFIAYNTIYFTRNATHDLTWARRGGADVAGWTLDRKIRVRFPAYPHRVWALWWQGGKRRLRTSRCPCRGKLGTLKTPSCSWRGCPAAGQNLETGHLSRQNIAEI